MARIADEVLTKIKSDVSLMELMASQGHSLQSQGKDYVMACPFHEDNTPSLVVSPDKNLWHCMGACQVGGSVIDWVMKSQGVSFRKAADQLQASCPSLTAESVSRSVAFPADCSEQQALNIVIDYYHETLQQSPDGLDYLERRGLNDPELIRTFKLGFADRSLGYHLPSRDSSAGKNVREVLQSSGLVRETGHEHFNGSLVVPVMDRNGDVVEVYGRKVLGKRLRKGTPQHLYLSGPHRGVWNEAALRESTSVILCESLIDAMTFWVNGFKNVTASYGTSGFTVDHLDAFIDAGIESVTIAYDRDEAGNSAADALAKKLSDSGMTCYRVQFPKGMDANEYANQVKPAAKSLDLVIRKALWMAGTRKEEAAKKEAADSVPCPTDMHAPKAAPALAAETAADPTTHTSDHEVLITLEPRLYRVRGLNKNLSYEQLKINLLVRQDERFHVDSLDIYSARHRSSYIRQASVELGVSEDSIKADLGKVLLKLESLQEEHLTQNQASQQLAHALSDDEVREALALLKTPNLLNKILEDFKACGVVGEETNKLVGYLAACSRKLDRPLAIMVQSSSAAGKSSLMEAVLAFMPEEERIQYSAMTGQSLFYMGETDLKHKILAIAEEEGATNTSYALKLLQSEGEVSIASTGKNPVTGNLETQSYRVEGPVMLFSTTTAIDIDEELMNRCLVLSVDESTDQTQSIHSVQRQRRTLDGLQTKQAKSHLVQLHQNAQRLLRPLGVVNPFADQLTFMSHKTRTRRDHEKYLSLIDTVALIHQYQREVLTLEWEGQRVEYIEVTVEDIRVANELAHEVLGRSLDELPPQTRKLLNHIRDLVGSRCKSEGLKQCDCRFTRKDVREYCGWGNTQLKVHLGRLEEMEYLGVHVAGRGKAMVYELVYSGEADESDRFMLGLVNPDELVAPTETTPVRRKVVGGVA